MDDKTFIKNQQQPSEQQQSPAVVSSPVQSQQAAPPEISHHSGGNFSLKKLLIGIAIVIVATVLIIAFFPRTQAQQVKLVWWGLWEDPKVIEPIIAEFERENPTIDIEYSKQDPKQYRERLLTRINLGTGPDIFRYHNTWYPMMSEVLIPLPEDVITQEEFQKNYYPVMQTDLVHNGGIYGIPLGVDTLALFVNTELLDGAGIPVPTTWEDFVTAAKQLTVKDKDGTIVTSGAALGTYGNVTHAPDIVSLLFAQQGVDMKNITASVQDEKDALDFYVSFATSDTNTWDSSLDQSLLSFSQGKLAMYFGYSWDIFAIKRLDEDLAFTVHPVPSLFNRNITIASYWVEGVSSKSTHQQEALKFMRYLSQKETAQKIYTEASKTRTFGEPYARVDLAETLKDNALIYPFVSQLKNAKSTIFSSDTNDGEAGLNSVSNTYLGNAINSVATDGSSSDSVIETLNQGIAQILSRYGIQ